MSEMQQSMVVLRQLRQDIMSGELDPGSAVSEASIAERYAAGRASARTALQRLSQHGLVSAIPRRGYVIARVTIRDVREIFQMRLALEPLAARLAAGRVDAKQMMKREEKSLAAWRACRMVDAEVLNHNRFIHMHIAEASGNARLAREIENLLGEAERSVLVALKSGREVGKMLEEHKPLIEALAAGDADLAEARARAHVETTMSNIMGALLSHDAVLSQPIDGLGT